MNNVIKTLLISATLLSCKQNDGGFDASGTFEAEEITVSAETSGILQQLDLREGAQLEQGQFLGWIDSTQLFLRKKQLQAQIAAILSKRPSIATQLASYRIQLEAAEREMNRILNLKKAEAATQKQADDARANVDVIRRQIEAHRSSLDISTQALVSETLPLSAQVEQINDQLQSCRIISPVSGTVLNQYARPHELVSPGKPLYKVADLTFLELRAFVTGLQLSALKINQPVNVYADDAHGGYQAYTGTLTWVSDKAEFTPKTIQTKEERADLVYAIKVRVRNDGLLKIGMYGELKFPSDGEHQ